MDKKQLESKLKDAQFDVLRAKNYQILLESPAWLELEQSWLDAEKDHNTDKAIRSLFDYDVTKLHAWGTDADGKVRYINGQQLLDEQKLEELRIEVYKGIMDQVRSLIGVGQDSANKLSQYAERKTKNKNK